MNHLNIMDNSDITQIILLLFFILLEIPFSAVLGMVSELTESEIEKSSEKIGEKCTKNLLNTIPVINRVEVNSYIGIVMINTCIGGMFLPKFTELARLLSAQITYPVPLQIIGAVFCHIAFIIIFNAVFMISVFIIGCLIPRRLVRKLGLKRTGKFIWFGIVCSYVFKPVAIIAYAVSSLILNIFGYHKIVEDTDVTEEEILSVVTEGGEQGVLEESEVAMISNIIEFGDKEAHEIMTNRSNIIGLDFETPLGQAIEFMLDEKKSRYPVFEENLDHIIGILNLKDAVLYARECKNDEILLKNTSELIREAEFVPETAKIDDLFHDMKRNKLQMMIVVDEYGQTSGLIAMEDILEEIVGDILDEYDEEDDYIEETGLSEYEIDGLTPLEDLEEQLKIEFETEEFETINGFIISKLEHIPAENEDFELEYKGYYFKILKVENRMIKSILVKKIQDSEVPETDFKNESETKENIEEILKK